MVLVTFLCCFRIYLLAFGTPNCPINRKEDIWANEREMSRINSRINECDRIRTEKRDGENEARDEKIPTRKIGYRISKAAPIIQLHLTPSGRGFRYCPFPHFVIARSSVMIVASNNQTCWPILTARLSNRRYGSGEICKISILFPWEAKYTYRGSLIYW